MLSYFKKRTTSGVFVPSNKGFEEYRGETENGSINDIIISLGYNTDQIYSPFMVTDFNKSIYSIHFEIFTRNIVFVLTNKKTTFITSKDIKKHLGDFSVRKYFDSLKVSDVLTDGVDNCSLSIEFMAKNLNLKNVSNNGVFYSDRIKSYLYFTNGSLTDFQFNDGFFPWAKHLKEVNPTVYNWLSDLAIKYWPHDDFQAKKEINIQAEAWSNIPNAFGNEFVPLHLTENGGANLHMIRVCHYGYPINVSQFKEINHGRYTIVDDSLNADYKLIKCGKFLYTFEMESERLWDIQQID